MQDLLGLGDDDKLKSAAGLAGGIGHQGAACGIVLGGALALGLACAEADTNQDDRAAASCAQTREFLRRFTFETGGVLCSEISRTDFDVDSQARKYYLTESIGCIRLASKSASILADIVEEKNPPPDDRCAELNLLFSKADFHCAHSTFVSACERLDTKPAFPPHALAPLDGGIAYSGSTCGALLGGCLFIGLRKCGDTSQNSILKTLRRTIVMIVNGSAGFSRTDLSPADEALVHCAELLKWFEGKYGSGQCREIVGIDFDDEAAAREFFEKGAVSNCVSMAHETAAKAVELAR